MYIYIYTHTFIYIYISLSLYIYIWMELYVAINGRALGLWWLQSTAVVVGLEVSHSRGEMQHRAEGWPVHVRGRGARAAREGRW